MRFYLFFLLTSLVTSLAAESLDTLLNEYKSESELSKKTKDENAGNLIVYTRNDLERMQVESLKDLLKSQRFFRYFENREGEPDLLNADPLSYSSKSIKIYLNNTELTNPIAGTGIILFGNIAMDFIDHVEIYQGFPSFEFAIEPALVVIKLYTKSPKKDAGCRIKALVGTNGSNKENIYTADVTENNVGYFLYANHEDDNRYKRSAEDKTFKRDVHTNHFYASFEKEATKLELNALKIKRDEFLGALPYTPPLSDEKEQSYFNATLSTKLLSDNSLSLHADYLRTSGDYKATYSPAVPALYGGFSTFEQPYDAQALTLLAKKEYHFVKHSLSLGLQFRHKLFDLDNIKRDGIEDTTSQAYTSEDIYSLFMEDSYAVTDNDLLSFSLMQQFYKRNKKMKDESPQQLRLGYIKSLQHFTAKTFLNRQQLVPEPYMTAEAHIGNPDLDPETYTGGTQEFSYKTTKHFARMTLGYTQIKDFLLSDTNAVIQNSHKALNTYAGALEYKYYFRESDELHLEANILKLEGSDIAMDSTHFNYVFRMLNNFSKLNIFNELVINKGYRNNQTGYDYSLGAKYALTQDLKIAFKGENVFNKGLKRDYLYTIFPTAKSLAVPVIEQKFMLSMEYLF